MKTIYFVRHGQSEGNISSMFQSEDSPLTEHGRKQAGFIAERVSRLPIETIIASTMPRAKETADIISERTGHTPEPSELFRERGKPNSLEGKRHDDPDAHRINEAWWKSLAGDGSRVENSENFNDLKKRAGECLDYLAGRREENILVVTHGFFLRYIVARAIFGAELSTVQFAPMMKTLWMENTGITALRYDKGNHWDEIGAAAPWVLWIWNDHAHLG
ncbi:MAG: histidine phosphatase family protein [Patescibacteria group bacterium]|nr:histidine phosphatase family protein [Patescibacteria group bacterium]